MSYAFQINSVYLEFHTTLEFRKLILNVDKNAGWEKKKQLWQYIATRNIQGLKSFQKYGDQKVDWSEVADNWNLRKVAYQPIGEIMWLNGRELFSS